MRIKYLLVFFTIFLITLLVLAGFIIMFFNSNYYYSRELVSAIKAEDIVAAQEIIEKKPSCINTYPSIMPKWFQSAMNWRVVYPLSEACFTNNVDMITLLLENGADPNCNDGLTPLSIIYSKKGHDWYAISLILIEKGASINYTTEYSGDDTAILRDIVKVRPGKNASDYIPEKEEEVMLAFYYAIEHCDHNQTNWMRVLQHSVSNNRLNIVDFLLSNGYCDVNDTSVGMTALMFAARDSSPDMIQLLLQHGADICILSSNGKTAYDYAIERGNYSIAELLR